MSIGPGLAWRALLAATALTIGSLPTGAALAQGAGFSFGVIGAVPPRQSPDAILRETIAATDADNLAFVVATGIKGSGEPCSDRLFLQRRDLFQAAKNGLIVSLAASDWSGCRTANGRSLAIERLNRIRELFFEDEFSFGATKLPLVRQASTPKFRTYVENLRWEIGNLVFATINLPANNNDYLAAAGRNSEFEDRMIADRSWLHRVFGFAAQKNAAGIVLFCDGDPLAAPDTLNLLGLGTRRDGFAEIRKQLAALSTRFHGKVLLVHRDEVAATASGRATGIIAWNGNLGDVAVGTGWLRISVDSSNAVLFAASSMGAAEKTAAQ